VKYFFLIFGKRLFQQNHYITSDPAIYPIPADKLDQAINQLTISVLKKVQCGGLFEIQPSLSEDPVIWIFRRKKFALPLASAIPAKKYKLFSFPDSL
jgi:hypothetical protein